VTPEGRIKAKVKKVLEETRCYYFMPVQHGYGAAGLDFYCILQGPVPFFIETKAPGNKLTPRQETLIERLKGLYAEVFVVHDDITLAKLEDWLDERALSPRKR
jgi:hypothetical protein